MRIEINSGGLFGTSVQDFAKAYDKMYKRNREVTRQFKIVRANVATMNGGIGNLQNAYDSLSARINKTEYDRQKSMEKKGDKFAAFLNNTEKTDKDVAKALKLENIRFAIKNPWAAEKSLKEKFWSGMDSVGHWLGDRGDDIKRWFSRAGHSIAQFMREHADAFKKIAIGIGVIVVIAGAIALTIATGGAASPLLVAALKGAIVLGLAGAATSAVVSGVVYDKSAGEVFDDAADGFMRGTFLGAAFGAMGAIGAAGGAAGGASAAGASAVGGEAAMTGMAARSFAAVDGYLSAMTSLFAKTPVYFVANVAGEAASYAATGKGFEDGYVGSTLLKSFFMAGGDAVGKIFTETFTLVTGMGFFSGLNASSWGGVAANLLMPSFGGAISGFFDNPGEGFQQKFAFSLAGMLGNTSSPNDPTSNGVDPKILIKTPGAKLQAPGRIDFLKNSINNDISRRFANSEINRASLMTRQRINKRFSYFTGGSYRQCLVAGACY